MPADKDVCSKIVSICALVYIQFTTIMLEGHDRIILALIDEGQVALRIKSKLLHGRKLIPVVPQETDA